MAQDCPRWSGLAAAVVLADQDGQAGGAVVRAPRKPRACRPRAVLEDDDDGVGAALNLGL